MSNKNNDHELRALIANLLLLIKEHGSRSDQAKKFIQDNKDVDEFVELAATCILYSENK